MTWGLVAVGGATLISGYLGSQAASNAANTQVAGANRSADLQYQQWQEQKQMMQPWLNAGQTALNALTPLALNYKPFDASAMYAEPGYQFRLDEGLKNVQQSAAARGLLQSGSTLKGLTRFGQDYASNEYQNAFNRYQAERQAQLGPLQSLAGVGQSTVGQLGSLGSQMASNIGETYQNAANARASGYIGSANAFGGAVSGLTNLYGLYNQNQLINALTKKPG